MQGTPDRVLHFEMPTTKRDEMKVQTSPWQRFVKLQRTVAKLPGRRGQPKGVFRFASHQEYDEWTNRMTRR